jgi:aryl-alcohol dehydrogenase-like predicted oxidoreductase
MIARFLTPDVLTAVQRLRPIADGYGVSMSQLAVAWVLQNPNVASAIIGASRPEHVRENVKAAGLLIPADLMGQIEDTLRDVAVIDPAQTAAGQPARPPRGLGGI